LKRSDDDYFQHLVTSKYSEEVGVGSQVAHCYNLLSFGRLLTCDELTQIILQIHNN
jgi:hypothetical protein